MAGPDMADSFGCCSILNKENCNSKAQKEGTRLMPYCPSVERAIASIIAACGTSRVKGKVKEEPMKGTGDREKKVCLTDSNWDRLGETESQGLLEPLL